MTKQPLKHLALDLIRVPGAYLRVHLPAEVAARSPVARGMAMPRRLFLLLTVLSLLGIAIPVAAQNADGAARADTANGDRHLLLIADRPSHGPAQHEHNAAVWLLDRLLRGVPGLQVSTSYDGWPLDSTSIERADAIFLFCSGGDNHHAFQGDRAEALNRAAERGAGLMFYHWCVEPPAEEGHPEMLAWIGGYFGLNHSVNPVWEPLLTPTVGHPIARGVQPFRLRDEWYFNMRFTDGMRGVTPILTGIPTTEALSRPDGLHSGNPDVRSKRDQPHAVVWAYERPGGGRGVGFTGGHFHANLGDANFRKVLLNSLLWISRVEVPAGGLEVPVTPQMLLERLDDKDSPR